MAEHGPATELSPFSSIGAVQTRVATRSGPSSPMPRCTGCRPFDPMDVHTWRRCWVSGSTALRVRPAESARSRRSVVTEVHRPAGEPVQVEQFEMQTDVAREGRLAAAHDDGRYEHV